MPRRADLATSACRKERAPNAADPPSQPPPDKPLRPPLESTQYVTIRYTERLVKAGIEPSVGSVGDSYDNALAETVIGLFKTEVIHRRGPWRDFEAVEFAIARVY